MGFFDFLFPPRADEAVLRGIPADDFLALIAPRLVPETRPGTTALLPFSNPAVRAAIHEAKYHGSERAFGLLSSVLADYIRDMDERQKGPVLVPVPLGNIRLRERGFNQVEEIAQRTARELDLIVDSGLLIRTRETATQVSLPRHEREKNMRNAFAAAKRADPSYTYIIVDDVLTTGATLQAALAALTDAGAAHIIPLALAH